MAGNLLTERADRITWTNSTGSAVASGAIVRVGVTMVGVALVDIANGASGAVQIAGVFKVLKTGGGGLDWVQGEVVYHDAATGGLTTVATDNLAAGLAYALALEGAVVGYVILNARPAPAIV